MVWLHSRLAWPPDSLELFTLSPKAVCSRMSCRFLCLLMGLVMLLLGRLESMAGPMVGAAGLSLAFGGASAHHRILARASRRRDRACHHVLSAWHCRDASENLAFGVAPHAYLQTRFGGGRAMSVAGELTVRSIRKAFGGVKRWTTSPSSLIRARWCNHWPNGAGKSTCFNMLGGQITRTRARYVSTATSSTALARLRSGGSALAGHSKSPLRSHP